MKEKIVISPSIVWWTIGIILAVGFLYVIRDVLVLFFIALVLSAAMEPAVKRLVSMRVPRVVSVGMVYILFLAIIAGFLSYLIPVAYDQMISFVRTLPQYMEQLATSVPFLSDMSRGIADSFSIDAGVRSGGSVSGLTQGIFSTTVGVFQGVVSLLAVFAMAFYLSIVEDGVGKFLRSVTPYQHADYVVSRAKIIYHKIGHWMLGQLALMFVVGILYFIVLLILGVPNALILALFGGALEIIPYIGPVAAAVPAIAFGFFVSPIVSVLIAVSYFLIQQLENHVIVPQIMKRAVGLNPIVVILSLLIGAKVAGVLGMILAVPVATAGHVFVKDVLERRK